MKKVKILTIILIIVLITMVGFFGVYVHVQNRMEDKVKDYSYAMDLNGARYVKLTINQENKEIIKDSEGKEVTTEEELTDEQLQEKGYTKESVPNNSEESLNVDNYKKSKEIIEKRLKEQNVEEYEVALNEENGEILVQIPENSETDSIVSNMNTVGKFEIIDSDTQEVLMDNKDIKTAKVMYGSQQQGTSVYLDIEFNKEGAKKLEEISGKYVKSEETNTTTNNTTNSTENATNETNTEASNTNQAGDSNTTNTSEENTSTEKKITMKIDDQEIMSTSFDEPIRTGTLQLSVGSATKDSKSMQDYIKQASTMASVLSTGDMPIQYDIGTNEYIQSEISKKALQYIEIAVAAIILIVVIVFIIRYRINGLLAGLGLIGMAAIYLLVIRYTNVMLSIQGIFGIIITLILNYILVNKMLLKIKTINKKASKEEVKMSIKESYKEFFIRIIPICIAVIVFCFTNWMPISSFGMVMFWGIVLIALYNYVITSSMLRLKADK